MMTPNRNQKEQDLMKLIVRLLPAQYNSRSTDFREDQIANDRLLAFANSLYHYAEHAYVCSN